MPRVNQDQKFCFLKESSPHRFRVVWHYTRLYPHSTRSWLSKSPDREQSAPFRATEKYRDRFSLTRTVADRTSTRTHAIHGNSSGEGVCSRPEGRGVEGHSWEVRELIALPLSFSWGGVPREIGRQWALFETDSFPDEVLQPIFFFLPAREFLSFIYSLGPSMVYGAVGGGECEFPPRFHLSLACPLDLGPFLFLGRSLL